MDVTYNLYNSGGSRPSDNGGGGGHPDPEIRGAGAVSKNFFSALRASVWPKKRGGGKGGGLLPWIRHCTKSLLVSILANSFLGNCLQFRHPSDKR